MSTTQVLQFVQVVPSGKADAGQSSETRRSVRAHARRQAHAAERLARTKKYQAEQEAHRKSELDLLGKSNSWQGSAEEDWCTIDIEDAAVRPPALHATLTANRFGRKLVQLGRFDAVLLDFFLVNCVPRMRQHCNPHHDPAYAARLVIEVVLPSLSDAGSLSCLLLAACRQIYQSSPDDQQRRAFFNREGSRYRLIGVRALCKALGTCDAFEASVGCHEFSECRDADLAWTENAVSGVEKSRITRASVFQAIMLATDEWELGNPIMSEQHARGAMAMVETGGGLEALGLEGLNAQFYARLVHTWGLHQTKRPGDCLRKN